MTTVGYGDITPETHLGRVIAIALMVVGIGFVAVLTAAIAERFLSTRIQETEGRVGAEVDQVEADVLAELRDIMARLQSLEQRLGQQKT